MKTNILNNNTAKIFKLTETFNIPDINEINIIITYFQYSEKGKRSITERKPRKRGGKAKYRGISYDQVCVLVARDRQKMTYSGVLGRGRIRTTKLDEAIGGHLSDSNVLCTDSWRAFSSYANTKGLAHYQFKSDGKQRVKGVYHSYHSRLKKWMDRFNGVATKYLQHYLAWFVLLTARNMKIPHRIRKICWSNRACLL